MFSCAIWKFCSLTCGWSVFFVQNTFYVTESAILRNRTVYFRLDDWEELCMPLVRKMRMHAFERVEHDEQVFRLALDRSCTHLKLILDFTPDHRSVCSSKSHT